jgi:hypothetical protein
VARGCANAFMQLVGTRGGVRRVGHASAPRLEDRPTGCAGLRGGVDTRHPRTCHYRRQAAGNHEDHELRLED